MLSKGSRTSQDTALSLPLTGTRKQFKALHTFLVDRIGDEDWEDGGYTEDQVAWIERLEAQVAELIGETPVYSKKVRRA